MNLYWFAAAAFLVGGMTALVRPQWILLIRAKVRPYESADRQKGGRRFKFGPVEVRICGVTLLALGAALTLRLIA
jgi:hypothetical protein